MLLMEFENFSWKQCALLIRLHMELV
jgi:hypothetical protein